MNLKRIYNYRFSNVDTKKKYISWEEISKYVHHKLGSPQKVLDPAAGMCEFINSIPAKEKWAADDNASVLELYANDSVRKMKGSPLHVDLPENYFDLVFVSNFLEHLNDQEEIAVFLEKMHKAVNKGGSIVVMGPNFKYAYKNYFDFADHKVILTELGVAEHLYGAGFEVQSIIPKFLPLSFRGKLPASRFLVNTYLHVPFLWRFFGKQFFVVGKKYT